MHTPPPSKRFRLTIIRSTTMWSMRGGTGTLRPWCMAYRCSPSRLRVRTLFPQYIGDVFVAFTECVMQIPQGGALLEIRSILHWKLSRSHRKETPA